MCTAGITDDGKWIRIYPVPFRSLSAYQQFSKFQWIKISLRKQTTDFRVESYRPTSYPEVIGQITTKGNWQRRRSVVQKEVFTSFKELLQLAQGEYKKSLATVQPLEITGFSWRPDTSSWPAKWEARWAQGDMFYQLDGIEPIGKIPYRFYYSFTTKDDTNQRKLEIIDWEIGALYWKQLKKYGGDEEATLKDVRKKYYDELAVKRDLHFFVGTNFVHHAKSYPNPFMIIGLFYPPTTDGSVQLQFDL